MKEYNPNILIYKIIYEPDPDHFYIDSIEINLRRFFKLHYFDQKLEYEKILQKHFKQAREQPDLNDFHRMINKYGENKFYFQPFAHFECADENERQMRVMIAKNTFFPTLDRNSKWHNGTLPKCKSISFSNPLILKCYATYN